MENDFRFFHQNRGWVVEFEFATEIYEFLVATCENKIVQSVDGIGTMFGAVARAFERKLFVLHHVAREEMCLFRSVWGGKGFHP